MPALHKKKGLSYQEIPHERHSLYCARGHRLFEKKDSEIGRDDLGKASFIARGYLHEYDLQRVGHSTAEITVETMEAQLVPILTVSTSAICRRTVLGRGSTCRRTPQAASSFNRADWARKTSSISNPSSSSPFAQLHFIPMKLA